LQNILSQIVKEAFETPRERFIETVEEASQLLKTETGKIGNLEILGRLVKIRPMGEALVIGDLHGDLESLIQILQESNFLQRMKKAPDAALIFLGDYGDRGQYSAEVYYTVLKLKLNYPEQVVLMRGNHEYFWVRGGEELTPSPHDLPLQFQTRFGKKWNETYAALRKLFEYLYNASVVEKQYLMIHGGLPQHAHNIEDLAYAQEAKADPELLEDMLWSDPDEAVDEVSASPRGAGKLFGKKVTTKVLKEFNVKILIRGHEPCPEGFKVSHNDRILTLFSRKGSPYFNAFGAYLNVNLAQKFEDATQLIPYIHKF
jgi:diadenosine tetraphosphatase ApaH/serine/threonine PP2A family protein phosphatase